jgi:DNA polymerase III subunit delta'
VSDATASTGLDPFASVIGQAAAVGALRAAAAAPLHAYLFVGPRGSGKRAAARAFAAAVFAEELDEPAERERAVRLALAGQHVDLVEIEPDSAVFRGTADRDQGISPAQRLLEESVTSPREARHKVIVAVDFHLANEVAIGRLLKAIEEPPESTVLVLLQEMVPPEQVTIASRCARVDFGAVPEQAIADHLRSSGVDDEQAAFIAAAAGGDARRAGLLASDEGLLRRYALWRSVPERLDGHGATVVALVDEIQQAMGEAEKHARQRHDEALTAVQEQIDGGTRARGDRRRVEEAHKRELRRERTDELRFGLATLAVPYREAMATTPRPRDVRASLEAVQAAAEALERNPVEELLLEALFLQLAPLSRR